MITETPVVSNDETTKWNRFNSLIAKAKENFVHTKKDLQNTLQSIDWESPAVQKRVSFAKCGAYASLSAFSIFASTFMLFTHLEKFAGNTVIGGASVRHFEPITIGVQTLSAVGLVNLAIDLAKAASRHLQDAVK